MMRPYQGFITLLYLFWFLLFSKNLLIQQTSFQYTVVVYQQNALQVFFVVLGGIEADFLFFLTYPQR